MTFDLSRAFASVGHSQDSQKDTAKRPKPEPLDLLRAGKGLGRIQQVHRQVQNSFFNSFVGDNHLCKCVDILLTRSGPILVEAQFTLTKFSLEASVC